MVHVCERRVHYEYTSEVGRCTLPVTKLELKAHLVSALETKM
jgi:hypothetical protein